MKNFKSMKKQLGFTLVEVGIVVAVVLLLLTGVIGVPKIIANAKANDEIGELKTITTAVQKIYATSPNYAGVTLAEVISLKGIPDERKVSATVAANRWGGAITMAPTTCNTANDCMLMTSNNVPEVECVAVIPSAAGGFARIGVAGTDVKPLGGALDKTALGTQCAGGNVTITYYFTK